jgi:23S rRNA pseudouridine2605 synthase
MSDTPRRFAPKAAATPPAPEGERIAKVLSRAGIASRREAERMIDLGQVTVNGKTITSAALNVTPADRITVAGQPVAAPEAARLWLYYKPDGLVTTASDEKGRETVFDRLPPDLPRVMTIGRLDLNSEGLLLLTNDGELKRRLELPSTGWLRKYRVRVKGNPVDPDLEPLRQGITVEGERFQPMTVTLDRVQGANAWLTIGLREGRNREIRRALSTIGLTVNRLIRVSYGPFRLGELQPGEVSEVRGKVLRDQLGLQPEAEDRATGTARARPGPGHPRGPVQPGARTPAAPATGKAGSAGGRGKAERGADTPAAAAGRGKAAPPAAGSGKPAVRRRTPAAPGGAGAATRPAGKGPGTGPGPRRPSGKGGPSRPR